MKCKLTPQWNITTYLPKWLKLNILITSYFNKDMEQPDFLTFLVAVHNGTTTVGGQFWQVPIKINMYLSDHPTNSIKEIRVCQRKDFYMNVHSDIILKSQKREPNQTSIKWSTDRQNNVYQYSALLCSHWKNWITYSSKH